MGRGGLVYSNQSKFSPLICLIKMFAYSLKFIPLFFKKTISYIVMSYY